MEISDFPLIYGFRADLGRSRGDVPQRSSIKKRRVLLDASTIYH
jgi:hypothetical protein